MSVAGVLRATVRVNDEPSSWATLGHSCVKSIENQFGPHMIGHRVADDSAGVEVNDDGKVEPAFPRSNVGDVADPCDVRRIHGELPFEEIRRRRLRRVGNCRRSKPTFPTPLKALLTHQSSDATFTHAHPFRPQIALDPRTPVGAAAGRVMRPNSRPKPIVDDGSVA